MSESVETGWWSRRDLNPRPPLRLSIAKLSADLATNLQQIKGALMERALSPRIRLECFSDPSAAASEQRFESRSIPQSEWFGDSGWHGFLAGERPISGELRTSCVALVLASIHVRVSCVVRPICDALSPLAGGPQIATHSWVNRCPRDVETPTNPAAHSSNIAVGVGRDGSVRTAERVFRDFQFDLPC
jgi:hypothetical protein